MWGCFCFAISMLCPTVLNAVMFQAFEKMPSRLSHGSREVKSLTTFSWLSSSSSICLFQITVCLVCNSSFLLPSNWCLVSFQRSFTLIIEAWDWDNDTKAGEYLCKTCSFHFVLYVHRLGWGEMVCCCN